MCVVQAADSWIDELEDLTCQEKESKVELACKFSNPKARVSWYKNKLEVFQGLKYKPSAEDGVFRLFITNVAMEDAGKYTCQANNQETSCYLTVEGERPCAYTVVNSYAANGILFVVPKNAFV